MANHNNFSIEIAYARTHVQTLKTLEVSSGCTVKEAIILSGIMDQFPEIDLTKNKIKTITQYCTSSSLAAGFQSPRVPPQIAT